MHCSCTSANNFIDANFNFQQKSIPRLQAHELYHCVLLKQGILIHRQSLEFQDAIVSNWLFTGQIRTNAQTKVTWWPRTIMFFRKSTPPILNDRATLQRDLMIFAYTLFLCRLCLSLYSSCMWSRALKIELIIDPCDHVILERWHDLRPCAMTSNFLLRLLI